VGVKKSKELRVKREEGNEEYSVKREDGSEEE
jgi:hypothetical protein